MSLSTTLKMPQISASAKENEKKNHFRECRLAEGGDLGDKGEWKQVTTACADRQVPPRLPHLPKCPHTTGTRP